MSKSTCSYWNPLADDQHHRWRWLEGLEGWVEEVILCSDPGSGEFTRLTRFHPGADTAAFGPTVHGHPEEILIVSGRLWDEACGMWLETGHYASRPPGEVHGPFRTEQGCVVLDVSFPRRRDETCAPPAHGPGCPVPLAPSPSLSAIVPVPAAEVLRFWFEQTPPRLWFGKDPALDALVRDRFFLLTQAAIGGELSSWAEAAPGGLALVLVLDQFPRQIWRDTALAFAGDGQALALSLAAVELGWVAAEAEQTRRQFWLMPQMHSENLAVQEAALPLFERFTDERTAEFARRHRDVIARFGRFPHRNVLLGRASSAEELAFLQTPGSRF